MVMSKDSGIRQTQGQVLGMPLTKHMTLGKLYFFSAPRFSNYSIAIAIS